MSEVAKLPSWANLSIISAVVLYFALFIYAGQTGSATAELTSQVLFAFIALGVGLILFIQDVDRFDPVRGAGLCLMTGGVAQLLAVLLTDPLLESVASIAVFAGIAFYILAIWNAK